VKVKLELNWRVVFWDVLPCGMVDVENSIQYAVCNFRTGDLFYPEDGESMFLRNVYIYILIFVFPCMLIVTQLLFQQNALVFIKSTRYYNLYFLSLYS
jgi:hypothetical protein